MRRIRLPAGRLERLMAFKGVGAGVVVTTATAGVIFAWLFRGAPQPVGVEEEPPSEVHIDLLAAWERHVIHPGANGAGQADGADGVNIGDVNGDSLPDVVVGHEQGLRVTVSVNPGVALVGSAWPTVTLPATGGNLCSAEDAVFADVDQDGHVDVVAACETGTVRVTVLFAPSNPAQVLTASAWTRVDLTASAGNRSMRVAVTDIAGDSRPELIVGGKESDGPPVAASLGYYSSATPRTGSSWTYTSIAPVGWIMQMYVQDLDADGDKDIVYSDRDPINVPALDNSKRGIRWLDSNGANPPVFTSRGITPIEAVHKWFSLADWDGDGDLDIADCRSSASINTSQILINSGGFLSWTSIPVTQPTGVGQCQHAVIVDLDDDGKLDLAFSYSNAPLLSGSVWAKGSGISLAPTFSRGEITGQATVGDGPDIKYDNLAYADLDGDGDLDVILTEQHAPSGNGPGYGVLWFENPLRSPP